ncbi:membrane protein UL148 [Cercopithecine betaherpesvirus 5]|uniref:Membrane protein UL148 n=1 Tax=Simian cytomegalovirus (strain Colburn) TaxID=50292 RepID=G8XTI3_SCMVC|nr:membrane protein UL148 [Cercopithecine betaherpesvirus 5]AEV80475.1 membrane protein UL148 [Cercopithecine betaherpesvirus 5]
MTASIVGHLTALLLLSSCFALVQPRDITNKVQIHMLTPPNDSAYSDRPRLSFGFIFNSKKFIEVGWAMCIDWETMLCSRIWRMSAWELQNFTETSQHPHDYLANIVVFQTKTSTKIQLALEIQPMQRNVGLYVAYVSFTEKLPSHFSEPGVDYARFALYLHTSIDSKVDSENVFKIEFHTFGIKTDPELTSQFVVSNEKESNIAVNFTTAHGQVRQHEDVKLTSHQKQKGILHEVIIKNTEDYQPWVRVHFTLYWRSTPITFAAVQYFFPNKQPAEQQPISYMQQQIYRCLELLRKLWNNPFVITVVLIFVLGALLKRPPQTQ